MKLNYIIENKINKLTNQILEESDHFRKNQGKYAAGAAGLVGGAVAYENKDHIQNGFNKINKYFNKTDATGTTKTDATGTTRPPYSDETMKKIHDNETDINKYGAFNKTNNEIQNNALKLHNYDTSKLPSDGIKLPSELDEYIKYGTTGTTKTDAAGTTGNTDGYSSVFKTDAYTKKMHDIETDIKNYGDLTQINHKIQNNDLNSRGFNTHAPDFDSSVYDFKLPSEFDEYIKYGKVKSPEVDDSVKSKFLSLQNDYTKKPIKLNGVENHDIFDNHTSTPTFPTSAFQ